MSEGTNRLIQQGAKLVTCGRDILEEYYSRFPAKLASGAPMKPEAARERLAQAAQAPETAAPPKARPEPEEPARERIPRQEQRTRFTDDELAILAALGSGTRSADELVELTQIPARRVLSALTMLQVSGAAEEQPGRRFSARVELEE